MITIDRLIGYLEAAKAAGATQIAVDVSPALSDDWPGESDLPRVEALDLIDNGDEGCRGQRIVVLHVEDLALVG